MKANLVGRHILIRGLLAVLAGGSLGVIAQGCAENVERELEVLTHPEANSDEFYNSYLMTHSWGQQLVKWWNQPV